MQIVKLKLSVFLLSVTKSFRSCFDQAYNDICDGFLGCLAWYSASGVPVAAAVYCLF